MEVWNVRQRGMRMVLILATGCLALVVAWHVRPGGRPSRASPVVQEQGLRLLARLLARVGDTDFGRSERGRALMEKVQGLLGRGRIIFTHEIHGQGLYREEFFGGEFLYVRVARGGAEGFLLPPQDILTDAVFHESVHALRPGQESVEEECDASLAGLAAAGTLGKAPRPEAYRLDGMSVGAYVVRMYPKLHRDTAYQPVGMSRGSLLAEAGLASAEVERREE